MERRSPISPLRTWLPLILQSAVFLSAGWGYAAAQEHRITVIEESIKNQNYILQSAMETQQQLADQLRQIEKIVTAQIALEDYMHRVKGAQ